MSIMMTTNNNRKNPMKWGLLGLLALFASSWWLSAAMASSAAPAPAAAIDPSGTVYVALTPPFITNYDGGGRLKYLKAELSVRARPPADEQIRLHMPYIRNQLIILFSSRLEEHLTSTEGKEQLRLQALQEIKAALDLLERPGASNNIQDLYFTSYVVQR
ncbi:MAG: flagellar basal body-associated FliL family protein [Pseudomonadales bacterium]|nr:flagellar basal body-associated FliL family protein [Pseudomonadales bacterium]